MPIALADFVIVPRALKYLVLFGLLAGSTVKIPIINVSIGEIFFEPLRLAMGVIGIHVTFPLFVILLVIMALVLFMITLQRK